MSKTIEYNIMVDPQTFATKEEASNNAKYMKVRILNHPVRATLPEIIDYLMNGHTVILGELEPSYEYIQSQREKGKPPTACKETWKSQQVFAIDIDNERNVKNKETGKYEKVRFEGEYYLETQDILEICQSRGIYPSVIYETLSSSESHRRYRVVFAVDKLITDEGDRERLNMSLVECFYYKGQKLSDPSCTDAARLFFPGKNIVYEDYDAMNSVKYLMDIPITYKSPERTKSLATERRDQIREAAMKSSNHVISLIANHEWDELKSLIAERIQSDLSLTATRDEGTSTKLQTFIKMVYRLTSNSSITKDIMSALWLDELKPVVVRARGDFYHSASTFPMEILFGYEAYENISCILPDHDDDNPSARFEYTREGKSKYKCYACCEEYSLDIFDLFETISGLSTTAVRRHLAYIFNMTLETNWQKEKREELRDFQRVYHYAEKLMKPYAPELYKRLKRSNALLFLEMLMMDVETYLPDKSVTGDELPVFVAEIRKISSWLRERNIPGSGKDAVQKKLHLAALLGLVEYLPEDSDSVFVAQAKAKKREKVIYQAMFHRYRVNIIRIPLLTRQLLREAEKKVKYLDSIGFRWSHVDKRSALIWSINSEEVSKQYVQDKENNTKSTDEINAFERFKSAAEDLLDKQGYFTQKDILSHKRVRQLKKKKELLAIVTPELLKSSEIEYTYYKSHYKDLYQIKQGKIKDLKPGRTKIYRRKDKD